MTLIFCPMIMAYYHSSTCVPYYESKRGNSCQKLNIYVGSCWNNGILSRIIWQEFVIDEMVDSIIIIVCVCDSDDDEDSYEFGSSKEDDYGDPEDGN